MRTIQRLLLAGTVLSSVAWLAAGATAWTSGIASDQAADTVGATSERAPLMLAQAPAQAPAQDAKTAPDKSRPS